MISVDTNVVLSALVPHEDNHAQAVKWLSHFGTSAPLVVAPVVYAELLARQDPAPILDFLKLAKIAVAWSMPRDVWEIAGEAFGKYARLRRSGNLPRRLIADFLIAAHAEHHELRVLTFDRTVYDALFPHLLAEAP